MPLPGISPTSLLSANAGAKLDKTRNEATNDANIFFAESVDTNLFVSSELEFDARAAKL